ncbi:MAG: hypothetical protein ABW185_29240 [Sedimenticola sp.]
MLASCHGEGNVVVERREKADLASSDGDEAAGRSLGGQFAPSPDDKVAISSLNRR